MMKIFIIKDDFVDTRLDRWFRKNVSELPQSLIEKYLRNEITNKDQEQFIINGNLLSIK